MAGKYRRKLRCGFTTGTAAAAATKAALMFLLSDHVPEQVDVTLFSEDVLHIPVHGCRRLGPHAAECLVIKDAGDDPDITHGAEIGARVTWTACENVNEVSIVGGLGVGQVTKPGLEVPPGQAAINPGPRKMIRQAVAEVLNDHGARGKVVTEIYVPRGIELARHTLNQRLGIMGGISILGTTGVVRPLSHDAYIATIRAALSVARAAGLNKVVLTTGRRSERFAQILWPEIAPEGFVQIGDHFETSMRMAAVRGFQSVLLCVFFGKAVKMAQGIPHTHARSARLTLNRLAEWTLEATGSAALTQEVAQAHTARHAFELLRGHYPVVIDRVGREMVKTAVEYGGNKVCVRGVVFGFDGKVVFDGSGN